MIKQILNVNEIDSNEITNDHYGRRFRALLSAYGVRYDFCRFYKISDTTKQAYFVVLNSSMTVTGLEIIDMAELQMFIDMNQVFSIEMPAYLSEKLELKYYNTIERVLFEFGKGNFPKEFYVNESPKLDEVFEILKESFSIETGYQLWLTDTSHQIRHGVSRTYLYKSTTATMYYNLDKIAFFGQIATSVNARGKGQARELLYWLEDKMSKNGISAQLFAKQDRVGFYQELGFKIIGRDLIFERKNGNE